MKNPKTMIFLLPVLGLLMLGAFVVPKFVQKSNDMEGSVEKKGNRLDALDLTAGNGTERTIPVSSPVGSNGTQAATAAGGSPNEANTVLKPFFDHLGAGEFDQARAYLDKQNGSIPPALRASLLATAANAEKEKTDLKHSLDESKALLEQSRKQLEDALLALKEQKNGPGATLGSPTKGNTPPFEGKLPDPVSVQFGFDSSVVPKKSSTALASVAKALKANPGLRIDLRAHADKVGAAEYNAILSKARGQSVMDVLTAQGVPSTRIKLVAFGASKADTPARRADLRKVDIVFQR